MIDVFAVLGYTIFIFYVGVKVGKYFWKNHYAKKLDDLKVEYEKQGIVILELQEKLRKEQGKNYGK